VRWLEDVAEHERTSLAGGAASHEGLAA
jgi:hypothetical protein